MARNELTGKRISTIAGRVLAKFDEYPCMEGESLKIQGSLNGKHGYHPICTVAEIKALAASALTQTADKPKSKRTKNVKKRSK